MMSKQIVQNFEELRNALNGEEYVLRYSVIDDWFVIDDCICDSVERYVQTPFVHIYYADDELNKLVTEYRVNAYCAFNVQTTNRLGLGDYIETMIIIINKIEKRNNELSELT